uniref:MARVEL domain-containing protein n=1 Tax=Caenorhabditis tropicalis TaxID=1561998 RepID=A0A1I7T179_9PELO
MDKKKKKIDKNSDIPQNFYFYLVLRFLAAICCVIVIFVIGLSQYWTNKVSAVFGLLFVIIALLFSASAVSILFIWDVNTTTLVKKCIFTLIFSLSVLVAAVMFLIANDGCDPRIITQYGCYQSVSTGTFQVASAFCFLILIFGLLDLGLNGFYFWRNSKRSPIYDIPPPSVAVVETEKSIHDIYMEYQRKGQTTSV